MTFSEFLARAAVATYVTAFFGLFGLVMHMAFKTFASLSEESKDLARRRADLEDRKRRNELSKWRPPNDPC